MLKEIITKATNIFIQDALDSEAKPTQQIVQEACYVAKIDISGDENYEFFIYIDKKTLTTMAYMFLLEQAPSEDILQDLIQEIANIIIGKAKVLAGDKKLNFDISTPEFISSNSKASNNNDLELNFIFEKSIFSIIGKEKNAS
jgi:CheY-specific phosphatase CheX